MIRRARKSTILCAFLLILGLLVGCASQPAAPAAQPAQPAQPATPATPAPAAPAKAAPVKDTLVIAMGDALDTVEPFTPTSGGTMRVLDNVFDTYLVRDEKMNIAPQAIAGWEAVDNLTWRLKIQKDVVFHNGDPFNAKVFKQNVEWYTAKGTPAKFGNYLAPVKEVKVEDDYTVTLKTDKPFPALLDRLTWLQPVPNDHIAKVGFAAFAKNPVGAGPYKFVRWDKGEKLVLEAFDKYWKGKPAIRQLTFRDITEGSTRVAALLSGEVDVIGKLPVDLIPIVQTNANLDVREIESSRFVYIGLQTLKPPFSDVRVRQAFNYAINFDELMSKVFKGHARRIPSLLAPGYFGYNPDQKPYPFDPEKAKALLKEAGYEKGLEVTFHVPQGRYLMDREAGEAIAGYLKKVGVNLKMPLTDWGTLVEMYNAKKFEMFLFGWGTGFDPTGVLNSLLHSKVRGYYIAEPEKIDPLLDQAGAITDAKKRTELYHKVLDIIHEDALNVYGWVQNDIYAVNKKLKWKPETDERIMFFKAAWQ